MSTQSTGPDGDRRVLVFFPTYDEAGNVGPLVEAIRRHLPSAHLLVVDDASPDGTGELLDRLAAEVPNLRVVHRPGKLGLGSAHKLAMLYAREKGYDALVTMDADFSHDPRYLPVFLELLRDADFVTGSRYARGGQSDYGLGRTIISRTANLCAKAALGLGLEENTTLYRAFSRSLLGRLDIDAIRSEGYSFAVESLWQVSRATRRLAEFPIHFQNRAAGESKISKKEIAKAALTIQRLGARRLLPRTARRSVEAAQAPPCVACGGRWHAEVYPACAGTSLGRHADASPYSCASHSSRSYGQILKCLGCGLVFMRPRLSPDALVAEYAEVVDAAYLSHIKARERTFRHHLGTIRRHFAAGDRILEVGSHCGAFLKVAREAGLDVTGLEPSAWAVEVSRGRTDADVVCGTLEDLPAGTQPFDALVTWDVMEHFADPVAELRKMNETLRRNGTLIFSTIMIDAWFPRVTGRHWPWYMDMHLFYFTEQSLRNVLSLGGFAIAESWVYSHVVALEYLLSKLGTLGLPFGAALARALQGTAVGRAEIPFRLGDAKLFVCKKTRDVAELDAGAPASMRQPALEATAR